MENYLIFKNIEPFLALEWEIMMILILFNIQILSNIFIINGYNFDLNHRELFLMSE